MIARRTSSSAGWLAGSSRLTAFTSGVLDVADTPWQAAHFCMYRYWEWCTALSPPQAEAAANASATGIAAARMTRAYPSCSMDDADRTLCDLIQHEFPVVDRPYAAHGERR